VRSLASTRIVAETTIRARVVAGRTLEVRVAMTHRMPGWPRRVLLVGVAVACLGLTSCKTVEFYQKQRLVDPAMKFEDDPTETHFVQKTTYSREGSVGGIGTGAGGGCGCY